MNPDPDDAPPAWFEPLLRCPSCRGSLAHRRCVRCGTDYSGTDGQGDFRLQGPVDVDLRLRVGPDLVPDDPVGRFPCGPRRVSGPLPHHLDVEIASWIPLVDGEATVLDLGCGAAQNRAFLTGSGYRYVGVDYAGESADMLADAHRLPFADGSFDLVLAMAVFEHLANPFVAISEIARVLKPAGRFVGFVAFQEPFHSRSYFHHSHLGVRTLLGAEFSSVRIGTSGRWDVLRAHAKASLFPGLPAPVRYALVWPVSRLSWFLWWFRAKLKTDVPTLDDRATRIAGSFRFVADR